MSTHYEEQFKRDYKKLLVENEKLKAYIRKLQPNSVTLVNYILETDISCWGCKLLTGVYEEASQECIECNRESGGYSNWTPQEQSK